VKSADAKPATDNGRTRSLFRAKVHRTTRSTVSPSIQCNNVSEAKVKGPIKLTGEKTGSRPFGDRNLKRRRRTNFGTSVASKYDRETKMAALASRKFSLFPQATSRTLLSRTLFQSQSTFHRDSQFSQHPRLPRVAQLPPLSSLVAPPRGDTPQ
jgi:hypothetical protein